MTYWSYFKQLKDTKTLKGATKRILIFLKRTKIQCALKIDQ